MQCCSGSGSIELGMTREHAFLVLSCVPHSQSAEAAQIARDAETRSRAEALRIASTMEAKFAAQQKTFEDKEAANRASIRESLQAPLGLVPGVTWKVCLYARQHTASDTNMRRKHARVSSSGCYSKVGRLAFDRDLQSSPSLLAAVRVCL